MVAQVFYLDETIPEACACCSPLTDLLTVKQTIQPVAPGTNRVRATCDDNRPVLIGNCTLDDADSATLANVTMFSFGFRPGDADTWGCSWNKPRRYRGHRHRHSPLLAFACRARHGQ